MLAKIRLELLHVYYNNFHNSLSMFFENKCEGIVTGSHNLVISSTHDLDVLPISFDMLLIPVLKTRVYFDKVMLLILVSTFVM